MGAPYEKRPPDPKTTIELQTPSPPPPAPPPPDNSVSITPVPTTSPRSAPVNVASVFPFDADLQAIESRKAAANNQGLASLT